MSHQHVKYINTRFISFVYLCFSFPQKGTNLSAVKISQTLISLELVKYINTRFISFVYLCLFSTKGYEVVRR